MTTIVHLLAIASATIIATVIIYRLIRKFEPQLAKGVVIIFAVFGGLLTSVASIKTNSPPARAIAHAFSLCTNAFNALEQQTGYSFAKAHTNEIHDLTMPDNAQLAERIARRGAHQDGFHHFDSFTNRLAREGLDLENPIRTSKMSNFVVGYACQKLGVRSLSMNIAQLIGTQNDASAQSSWNAGVAIANGANYTDTVSALVTNAWPSSDTKTKRLWPNTSSTDNFRTYFANPNERFMAPGFVEETP